MHIFASFSVLVAVVNCATIPPPGSEYFRRWSLRPVVVQKLTRLSAYRPATTPKSLGIVNAAPIRIEQPNELPKVTPPVVVATQPTDPCAKEPEIENGFVTFIDPEAGFAIFACNQGFDIVGSITAMCDEEGAWNALPTCKGNGAPIIAKTTPRPVASTSTTSTTTMTTRRFPDVPVFPPVAEPVPVPVGCGSPPDIKGGSIEFEELGVFAIYVCDNDKVLVGDSNVFCNPGGKWSERPRCLKETSCGVLPVVAGAIVSDSNIIPGARSRVGGYAVFTCVKDNNKIRVECLQNGQWSHNPSCVPTTTTAIATRPRPSTPAPVPSCPSAPFTHLIFLFDLVYDEINGGSPQQLEAVISFLKAIKFRQRLGAFNGGREYSLGAVALFETSSRHRPALSETFALRHPMSAQASAAWSNWLQVNAVLLNKAEDSDVSVLFNAVPDAVGLGRIPLAAVTCEHSLGSSRIVYVTNALRSTALVRATADAQAIKKAGGKLFILGFGAHIAGDVQQLVLKARIASDNRYFKYYYAPTVGDMDSLTEDSDFQHFLRFTQLD